MQVLGQSHVYVLGDTVDLPVSKAGGACHNQSPVVVNNIASQIRFGRTDRKSTRLNSSHLVISYAVFCLKKKTNPSARSILSPATRAIEIASSSATCVF